MNDHASIDPELRDQAIQYAFGTLDEATRARFEARLEHSEELRGIVADARALADDLGTLVPEAVPPPGFLARIRARIEADEAGVQPWKRWREAEAPELGIVFRDATWFEPTAIEGIQVRRLALDAAADRVTLEILMAPGSKYPAHRHGGVEECFVLEGDIDVGGVVMHAGDYQRLEGDSLHPVQSTRGGCRLLIVSSLRDELI